MNTLARGGNPFDEFGASEGESSERIGGNELDSFCESGNEADCGDSTRVDIQTEPEGLLAAFKGAEQERKREKGFNQEIPDFQTSSTFWAIAGHALRAYA